MKLLLVEDDERVARGIMRLVTVLGHVAVHVRTPDAARAELGHGDVDVLLTDFGLEGHESGIDLVAWSRAHHPDTRCVLTSGTRAPTEFVVEPPSQLFIHKPFGKSELMAMLDRSR